MAEGLRSATPAGRWVIAATVLGSGIATLDATVVGIVLPTVGREFHVGIGTLQWVVTGYTLTLAAFLLLGGSLGDRYGRRRVFSIGVAWFATASLACGFAPNAAALIAARVVQGIGAALLTPGSLAILQASFVPSDRARAIGAWSGFGGLTAAAGPLIGGELINIGSWRWVFFVNLPISVVVLVITARHVPETLDPDAAHHLDVVGAALAVVSLSGLTYALIEGPTRGWGSPGVAVALALGVVGLPSFVTWERRTRSPMLPLSMFGDRQFSATNAVTFAIYAALAGALFLLPVELQIVSGYSPLASGLALLPVTLIMLTLSARSGRLASRLGPRLQMSAGPVIVGAGLALLSRATAADAGFGDYVTYVLPAVMVFGLGLATTVAPLTATALDSAPASHAGLASAVNNDVARAAGLLAVAVLPVLAGVTGASYLHPSALAAAFRRSVSMAAGLCAAGGVLAALTIRNPPRTEQTPPAPRFHCALDGPPPHASASPVP